MMAFALCIIIWKRFSISPGLGNPTTVVLKKNKILHTAHRKAQLRTSAVGLLTFPLRG
jgi:hypothetical protein